MDLDLSASASRIILGTVITASDEELHSLVESCKSGKKSELCRMAEAEISRRDALIASQTYLPEESLHPPLWFLIGVALLMIAIAVAAIVSTGGTTW